MTRMRTLLLITAVVTLTPMALALAGCPQSQPVEVVPIEPPESAMGPVNLPEPEVVEPPAETADAAAGAGQDMTIVRISTARGDMTAELWDQQMPITAGNFILLAEDGFFDGLTFHRVEPGFVIQGGDPNGDGSGGPGFTIPLETNKTRKHDVGVLSMARTSDPDSAGSQFFVCLGGPEAVSHLDPGPGNPGYAAFGRVIEGMDIARSIKPGDKITKVTIVRESSHADAARAAAKSARVPD